MKWLYALALILGLYAPAYCQEIGIGDSLAVGIIQAGGLEGIGRVGASPSAVYQMVRNYSAEGLRDAVVILSCGASNNPDQIEFCLKDMDVLKLAGARIVLLGVGSSLPNSVEINKLLADIYRRLDKLERPPVAGEVAKCSVSQGKADARTAITSRLPRMSTHRA